MYLGADDVVKTDRRGSRTAVPPNIDDILTQAQRTALLKVENFGWSLAFVRQPLFQEPVAVVCSPDLRSYAVLEIDGELNRQSDITIRH